MLPGSATILSKKTGATEVTLGQLETFTSYYVKVAISTLAVTLAINKL